jgi:hypothetical protein
MEYLHKCTEYRNRETAPANKLSVKGDLSVGSGYSTTAAPTNGAIIQGSVGIGISTPSAVLSLTNTSSAELTGTSASTTFRTFSGTLGTTVNSTFKLGSFGFFPPMPLH